MIHTSHTQNTNLYEYICMYILFYIVSIATSVYVPFVLFCTNHILYSTDYFTEGTAVQFIQYICGNSNNILYSIYILYFSSLNSQVLYFPYNPQLTDLIGWKFSKKLVASKQTQSPRYPK